MSGNPIDLRDLQSRLLSHHYPKNDQAIRDFAAKLPKETTPEGYVTIMQTVYALGGML